MVPNHIAMDCGGWVLPLVAAIATIVVYFYYKKEREGEQ